MASGPGDRLYRLLLRLFPAEFRGDFGDDMAADFRDARADARRRGVAALARLWWRTVPGLVLAGARAWLDDLACGLHFALRAMGRSPGFSAAAILMLAVGLRSRRPGFNGALRARVNGLPRLL
jgi:hypothetical protein